MRKLKREEELCLNSSPPYEEECPEIARSAMMLIITAYKSYCLDS